MWIYFVLALFVCGPAVLEALVETKMWDYTLISLETNSTDEKMMKPELKIVRLGRNDFAISGTIEHNFEIDENHMVEVQVLRSPSGSSNYSPLPFRIPKQTQLQAMGGAYKKMLMDSLKDCSDAPQQVGDADPVFENKKYTFNQCKINTDSMPKHLQAGFYKIIIIATGPVGFVIMGIVEVESK